MDYLEKDEGRKRVEKEDELINNRMSWCVSANAFLLAAYVLAGNNQYDQTQLLQNLVSVAGSVISASFFVAILAAWHAIWFWRSMVKPGEKSGLYSPVRIALPGSVASICAPVVLLSVWLVLICTNNNIILLLPSHEILVLIGFVLIALIVWYIYFLYKESKLEHKQAMTSQNRVEEIEK